MNTLENKTLCIRDLKPNQKNIRLRFIVLDVGRPMSTKQGNCIRTCKVADRTGCINMSIWDDYGNEIQPADILDLVNGYTNIFKECLTLYTGKAGELFKVGEFCLAFNDELNMSLPMTEEEINKAMQHDQNPYKNAFKKSNGEPPGGDKSGHPGAVSGHRPRSGSQGHPMAGSNRPINPGNHQHNHPGNHPQNHPGNHPQNHPGNHPQNHPGNHPQNHPGNHPQNHPGNYSPNHPPNHPPTHGPPPFNRNSFPRQHSQSHSGPGPANQNMPPNHGGPQGSRPPHRR